MNNTKTSLPVCYKLLSLLTLKNVKKIILTVPKHLYRLDCYIFSSYTIYQKNIHKIYFNSFYDDMLIFV